MNQKESLLEHGSKEKVERPRVAVLRVHRCITSARDHCKVN